MERFEISIITIRGILSLIGFEGHEDLRDGLEAEVGLDPERLPGLAEIDAQGLVRLGPAQGDACPLPFTPVSGKVVGTAASNTCAPNAYPTGTLEPLNPRTLCCK